MWTLHSHHTAHGSEAQAQQFEEHFLPLYQETWFCIIVLLYYSNL
jgi:hypothetical protein